MAYYTKRVQTVLSKGQYEQLLALAERTQKPVSALIREAVVSHYFAPTENPKRQQALANLLALDAPVAEWPQMEAEIEQGRLP